LSRYRLDALCAVLRGGRAHGRCCNDLSDAQRALAEMPKEVASESALVAKLRSLTAGERLRHLVSLVQVETASVLGHSESWHVEVEKGFFDLGLDSLTAVELRVACRKQRV